MKCISCEMEINPQWKHAIDMNVCPFCGKGIMEEHLKNLLSSLRETMDQLVSYPDQLNDWMLSNHNYIKTDSENLHHYVPRELMKELSKDDDKDFLERKNRKFMVKVTTETGEQEVQAEKIQSEEKTNEFFKRAEAVKPNIDGFKNTTEKTQHLKAMAQQIRREGATVMNQAGVASTLSPEMMEVADPQTVAEMQSLLADGDIISSALPEGDVGGDDDIPSVILNMANAASRGGHKDPNDDLRKLQQLQAKAQRNSLSGRGGFSRS